MPTMAAVSLSVAQAAPEGGQPALLGALPAGRAARGGAALGGAALGGGAPAGCSRRLAPTAFAAPPEEDDDRSLNLRLGRTAEGSSCHCTDPIKKVKGFGAKKVALAKGLASKLTGAQQGPERDHDEVAEELRRQQRKAERDNADLQMSGPMREFRSAKEAYDAALQQADSAYKSFAENLRKYDQAFWDVKATHDFACKPAQEMHKDVTMDCEQNYHSAMDQYFARRSSPQCLVGKAAGGFGQPVTAALPEAAASAAACGDPRRARGDLRSRRRRRCPSGLPSFL